MNIAKRISAFSPDGAMIVARFDNILACQEVDIASWEIGADGVLTYEFASDSASVGGDGSDNPATRNGFPLYRDAKGAMWAEDQVRLYALDANDKPSGEPIPFTPQKLTGEGVLKQDDALYERAAALLAAARAVVASWEKGDLAGAVNLLEAEADALAEIVEIDADMEDGA